MVRFVSFIMILCLLLSSCGTSSPAPISSLPADESQPEFDMPLDYAASRGRLCKYHSTYYYEEFGWVSYYDEETGTFGKLCGKPDCTHEDISCNAYISEFGHLQVYDGMLYFMGEMGALYRMDLSGNQREAVMNVRILSGANGTWMIHRGYIYTSVFVNRVENGENFVNYSLCRYPLGSSAAQEMIFEKDFDQLIADDWMISGNSLFLSFSQGLWGKRELYHYDLDTGELTELISGSYSGSVSNFQLTEDGIVFAEKDKERIRVTKYDFSTGDLQKLHEWNDANDYLPGLSIHQNLILFYKPFIDLDSEQLTPYRVLKTTGEEVFTGAIDGSAFSVNFYGCDNTGFLLERIYHTEVETSCELWRISYDTGEAEMLIRLVRAKSQ